ncbi:hypothetical protein ABIE89_008232 [Bradyrhizobium niftali]|uniref:hypothetical protein n=1 Tax=Bradyrhizobium niftali TaxID=2560055 RepID=UPI0038353E3E
MTRKQVALLAPACNEAGQGHDVREVRRYRREDYPLQADRIPGVKDKILNEGVAQLIEKMLAEKASLHPESDKK